MLNVTRFSHPKIMVPAVHLLVDIARNATLANQGTYRIAGTRKQALPAGTTPLREAPGDILRSNAGARKN